MSSSETMGDDMVDAIGGGTSYVKPVSSESFVDTWNQTAANHVIIHTHGSPDSLVGTGFKFTTNDGTQLQQNTNIKYVLIIACEVGGNNGTKGNIGQLISQKIATDGIVVCSTTIVSGGSKTFTATNGGCWIAYQNGKQIPTALPTTITMEDIAAYWY